MKHLITAFIISMVIAVSLSHLARANKPVPTDTGLKYSATASQFKKLLLPLYFPPKTISIPRLGINQELQMVGVVNDRIGVPSDWQTIGYFAASALAGEAGNTIIVGHLDDNTGAPAAFWGIRSLVKGDTIEVSDGHRVFKYEVLESALVLEDGDGSVLQEDLGGPGLILITCGGTWNFSKHTYSQRLLVKAVLVRS